MNGSSIFFYNYELTVKDGTISNLLSLERWKKRTVGGDVMTVFPKVGD